MRFTIWPVLCLAFLAAPATAQAIDPETPACKLLSASEVAGVMGKPATITETNNTTPGMTNCRWTGGEGLHVRVHLITFASQKIQGGTALDYFRQNETFSREQLGADTVKALDGIGQRAILIAPPENPTKSFGVRLLLKDDTITVETYGLDAEKAIALARIIAGRP